MSEAGAATKLERTPLHAAHQERGARMVDFSGWSMPLHYGSQLEEHHRVRRDAGVFDVSHMLAVDIGGRGAREFLRTLLANDVDRLKRPGTALYTCMLDEEGGVLDDLIVYAMAEGYRVVVNAGTARKDVAWMQSKASDADAGVSPRRDLAILAIQGPAARDRLWAARPQMREQTQALKPFEALEAGDVFIARTGYTGEDGFEVMLPAAEATALWDALLAVGVWPVGLAARDTLRLEAGMNLYGQDMDESVTPYECGLAWTVSMKGAREFVGRRALEKRAPRSHFTGVVLEDRGVMRAHQRVLLAAGEGEVTSGGFSPTMSRSIALARVPVGTQPGSAVDIEMRGRQLRARTVKPPFVRHGKVLVETT